MGQAKKVADKKAEIQAIVKEADHKMRRERPTDTGLFEYLRLFGKMLTAHIKGSYRMRRVTVVYIVAGLLYFINPFDAIPDMIIGAGLIDDATVLAWVAGRVRREIDRFRQQDSFEDIEVIS